MRMLTKDEWKQATSWHPYRFAVKLGDKTAFLYSLTKKKSMWQKKVPGDVLSAGLFNSETQAFDMSHFIISTLLTLTKRDLSKDYAVKRKVKEQLWSIYGVPFIDSEAIDYKRYVEFVATPKPNRLGFYYAQIANNNKLRFMNDDVAELLLDVLFTIECYLGREELPKTFSQYWFQDFQLYGDRRYPDNISRNHTKPIYYNYGYEQIMHFFNSEKISHTVLYDMLQEIKEDKYYIMEILLNDEHFVFTDEGLLVYYPLVTGKAEKIFARKGLV